MPNVTPDMISPGRPPIADHREAPNAFAPIPITRNDANAEVVKLPHMFLIAPIGFAIMPAIIILNWTSRRLALMPNVFMPVCCFRRAE